MFLIVHIITRFVNGGADENTLLTCNHQAEAGHEVWLVHGREYTDRMIGLLDPRVKVVSLPALEREISPLRDLSALLSLVRLFRRVKPVIVHTHTSKAGIIGRFAAFAVPRATIVHGVHILPFTNEPFVKRNLYLLLEKLASIRTKAFIDVSEGMRDLCIAHSLGTAANHFVIRSGMDVERFRRASPAADVTALRRSGGTVVIGYVAVLERRKRHRELLQALMPLLERHESAILVFAGDGPERPAIEEAIRSRGLSDRILVLGFREDVERVLAACDICVFVSQREGLPRSVVQYVIAGKPVVATHLPGIESVVREGINGHIAASDDFDGFTAALERLLSNRSEIDRLAKGSAAIDVSEWDARVMTDRIEMTYAQVSNG